MEYVHYMFEFQPPLSTARRPTNVTMREDLVSMAKSLNINVSQACEAGLAAAVKVARETQWLDENRAAIDYCNEYVDENGLILERYRTF